MTFRGGDVTASLRRLPIAFIHQDLGLIDWMTVAENICLTLGFPRRYGLVDWARGAPARRRRRSKCSAPTSIPTSASRASAAPRSRWSRSPGRSPREAEILVLDEPTASLPADEVARLFAALRRLRARGVGMIYVSHRLDEVFEIADRMVVLRDGRVVGERHVAETTPDEVILLIVGREPSQVFRRPAERDGSPRLVLDRVMVDAVGPVDCEIHAGEIVGFVGLRGAGQESVGRALFGVLPTTRRAAFCSTAKTMAAASPREAMATASTWSAPIGSGESIMPNLTVRENLFLNPVAAGLSLFSMLGPGRESRAALDARPAGRACGRTIRPADRAPVRRQSAEGRSSGAGCISQAKVYVFEDPTAGVDVGAKAEIYRLFDVALQAGAAIVIVSTDFEEVAKVCHRALVFDRGRVVAELARGRSLGRESARRGFRQHRPFRQGGAARFHRAGSGTPCSPLNPTRSSRPDRSSPGCRAGGRSDACCRSTACRS